MTYQKITIPLDHGNRNMKTAEEVFTSGLVESDLKPVLGEYLEYKGKYYSLTGERIPYMRDKTLDDRFFILTLFGIGKELERRTQPQKDTIYQVELPVGLPPKHYGALFEKFGQYFVRPGVQRFTFNKREYLVQITKAAVFPQDYAAAMTIYPQIATYNRVVTVDIGGFTLDYLLLREGRPDLSVCDSLEKGVITLYNRIIYCVSSDFDMLLEDTDIDTIILGKNSDYSDSVIRLVKQMTKQYVDDFLGALRERGIDLKTGCIVFIGGGAKLLREYLENTDKIGKCVFVEDICANAKGYEILYQVAEFLNSLEREKAQYIVKAVLTYRTLEEKGEVPQTGGAVSYDYETIKSIVLQIMREQGADGKIPAVQPETASLQPETEPKKQITEEDPLIGFDESAMQGIMASLSAFQNHQ